MLTDVIIYAVLATTSFLNIVVPISGSSVITPLLAILTDPHRAIGLTAAYFVLSGIVRIFLFRKNIQWGEVKILLPFSLVAGAIGALSLVAIDAQFLLLIIFAFTIYFFFKKIGVVKINKNSGKNKYTSSFIGLLSGFLQGTGLPGSDLRNSYLYSRRLSIIELHGTTAVVGWSTFLIATLIRLGTDQLIISDIIPLLYIFPIIVAGTLIGRHVLYKMEKKLVDGIIIFVMLTIIIFLGIKIFGI